MEKEKVIEILCNSNYYTQNDLRYNKKVGILFSKEDLLAFLVEKKKLVKDGVYPIKKLNLKTFNSEACYYSDGMFIELNKNEYINSLYEDYEEKRTLIFDRQKDSILTSRIFSEIEGTLNIENVPTTRKRIKDILTSNVLQDKNDVIIRNMLNAIKYISEKPDFNKENLLRLYNILSENCLDDDNQLKNGAYYRDDYVQVGGYDGAPIEKIEECMNSLFEFANDENTKREHGLLLPHICHYYILYVHPYFDYNGRTARMVSLWISVLNNIFEDPIFISEAINEHKNEYYKAIINTRTSENDLTYFLGYILESSIKFSLIYKNLEEINQNLAQNGEFLPPAEQVYLKKILIHNTNSYFNYKMFLEYINNNMSKVGAFKILNHLNKLGVLEKKINSKKETIFKINTEFLVY